MTDMRVKIAGVEMKNPIITASGAFGYGMEYNEFYDISLLGGISCKGTTVLERQGNPGPRIAETPSGMLNSVGLQNPGSEAFINTYLPWLRQRDITVISNVAGHSMDEYVEIVRRVSDANVDMVELNISCPNVKEGGMSFGTSCESVEAVVSEVRKVCKRPLIVKLTPNVTDIGEIAKAAEAAGADAVSLINTLTGMRIDIRTRRPILKNNIGGLSGPAVFPVAVRMVRQVYKSVNIPIIGMGGVATWEDAAEMMMAGAAAIQVGAALFRDPYAPLKIIDGLKAFCEEQGLASVTELTGTVEEW
ncbi:MAG: dihydroorotate dehydrogenase [Ruminococcaceae bacterium]|nr:dihydroorotate dehydrogenase [Oscillospiraceae bacterium]